jgi:hypothetical protein
MAAFNEQLAGWHILHLPLTMLQVGRDFPILLKWATVHAHPPFRQTEHAAEGLRLGNPVSFRKIASCVTLK